MVTVSLNSKSVDSFTLHFLLESVGLHVHEVEVSALGNFIAWSSTPVIGPSALSSATYHTIDGVVKVSLIHLSIFARQRGSFPSVSNVVASLAVVSNVDSSVFYRTSQPLRTSYVQGCGLELSFVGTAGSSLSSAVETGNFSFSSSLSSVSSDGSARDTSSSVPNGDSSYSSASSMDNTNLKKLAHAYLAKDSAEGALPRPALSAAHAMPSYDIAGSHAELGPVPLPIS